MTAADRLRVVREAEWSDEQGQQHPRGRGAQGGQFVAKDKGQSGQPTKRAPRIFGASDKVAQEIAEARARHAQKTTKKKAKRPDPTMPAAATPSHSFRSGDTGEGVSQLQALMSSLGLNVGADGKYGPQTEGAVRAMQAKLGMAQTGRASARLIRRMQDAKALSPCIKESSVFSAAALFRRVREAANFDDVLHPRDNEGKFRTVFDRVNRALTEWAKGGGSDHPIEDLHLSRPSLMRVSKKMGVTPRRGAPDNEIEDGILAKAREIDRARRHGERETKLSAPAEPKVHAPRELTRDDLEGVTQNLGIAHGDELKRRAKLVGVTADGTDNQVRDRIRAKLEPPRRPVPVERAPSAAEMVAVAKAAPAKKSAPRKAAKKAPEAPSIMEPSDGPALYNPDGAGWGALAGAWTGAPKTKSGPVPAPSAPAALSAAEKARRRKILAAPMAEPTALRPEHGIGVFSQDSQLSAQAGSGLAAAVAPATAAAKVRAAKAAPRKAAAKAPKESPAAVAKATPRPEAPSGSPSAVPAKAAKKATPGRTGGAALTSLPIRDSGTLAGMTTEKVDSGAGFEYDEYKNIAGVPGDKIQDALADYESNGHEFVNGALRIAGGDLSAVSDQPPPGVIPSHYSAGRVRDQAEGVDAAMTVSRTTAPIVVHRGVKSAETIFGADPPADLVGREWIDHGYVSTSVDERATREFASNGAGVRMTIQVPEGVGALGIENSQPGLKSEREVLLQRGLRFRVTGDRTEHGERHIDVEVVPDAAKAAPAKKAAPRKAPRPLATAI